MDDRSATPGNDRKGETSGEKTAMLVFASFPDKQSAAAVGSELIAAKLAACVQIQPACESIYRWQGEIKKETEVQMTAKTSADSLAAAIALIKRMHSFEVPEIIAVRISDGLPEYLRWINSECRK